MDTSTFEGRMAPERSQISPPITWSGWWDHPADQPVEITGLGTVTKVSQTDEASKDSYSYAQVRTMVFGVVDRVGDHQWFMVSKESSSFDSGWYNGDEAWEYPSVAEVVPEQMQVTRWQAR